VTPFVAALLIKLTLILTAGLVVSAISRRLSPSVRHLALYAALVSSALLPLAMWLSPNWNVPVLPRALSNAVSSASDPGLAAASPRSTTLSSSYGFVDDRATAASAVLSTTPTDAPTGQSSARGADIVTPLSAAARAGLGVLPLLPLLWAIGCAAVIAWLIIGHIGLRRIAARSWPLDGENWNRILEEERTYARVTKPVILRSSSAISTPLTWGVRVPVVLMPEDALEWPEAHARIVLRHELAHVARGDALTQLAAGVVCAAYWFHPLAWMTERRLRAECERACDDNVVSLGTPAAEYAAHLLEVARSARAFGAAGFLSVAMARPSQLEGRLLAVLNESRRRVRLSRRARPAAAFLSAIVLLPLAAFRAVPSTDARVRVEDAPRQSNNSSEQFTPAKSTESNTPASVGNKATAISGVTLADKTQQLQADTTFQLSVPARSGGTLTLDLRTGGKIIMSGWDRQEVSVRALLRGRDWRATKVTLEPSAGGALLASEFTASGSNQSSSHVFEIKVPRSYNAALSSAGGSVSIAGVDGSFRGQIGGGEINIEKVNGSVDIQTGGGDIHVSDSHVDGNVSTGGGVVRIEGVTGNIIGESGSGPVIQSKSSSTSVRHENGTTLVAIATGDGDVHVGTGSGKGSGKSTGTISSGSSIYTSTDGGISTTTHWSDDNGSKTGFARSGISMSMAGGPISLAAAPDGARVTTGGGRIRIGPSGGEVYASTGGGDIDIGPATGSVEAHTGGGDVKIELKGAGAHSVNVTSGRGEVVLVVPRDLDATLELETAYTNNLGHATRILSDFPLKTTETADWDAREGTPRRYVRARQTVGKGGGIIRVRTVNGNVVLNRAR
jgi:beta-lactamase regulating signal transducer with metallopeptidase domain